MMINIFSFSYFLGMGWDLMCRIIYWYYDQNGTLTSYMGSGSLDSSFLSFFGIEDYEHSR